jgi:hypothetical protein
VSKPRKQADIPVSLFPFLSVLACVIGVLTLMLSALSVGQIFPPPDNTTITPPVPPDNNTIKEIKNGMKLDEDKRQELNRQIQEAESVQKRLAEAQAELARLKALPGDTDGRAMLNLLEEHKRLRTRKDDMEKQLTALNEEIEKLKKQGPPPPPPPEKRKTRIRWRGDRSVKPRLIECTADALVIHPGLKRIPKADIEYSTDLEDLCREVKAHEADKWIVIFLIRPDGVETYHAAQAVAEAQGVQSWHLPAAGHDPLDLSDFLPAGK